MSEESRVVLPGIKKRTVRTQSGDVLQVPEGWRLLPPGDAGLTRKVKALGPSWTVQYKKGRRMMSKGVWAPQEHIEQARVEVEARRSEPSYQKKLDQSRKRRAQKEIEYASDFKGAILDFLQFAPSFSDLAEQMAQAITEHAVPVGSGTVARTKRISLERRAEAAVIAWMRHQTSAYDHMSIPRIKGARRDVRQRIARRSRELLHMYREGEDVDTSKCPLYKALSAK